MRAPSRLSFIIDVELPHEHSFPHVFDDGGLGRDVLETDGVPHLLAERAPDFLGDALRHGLELERPINRSTTTWVTAALKKTIMKIIGITSNCQ